MKDRFKRWWNGKYIPPENDPDSPVVIMQGRYEQHWTSKLCHRLAEFWQKHWQWSIGIAVALFIGLYRH